MPVFEATTELTCAPQAVYQFLTRPTNLLLVTPPTLSVKLVSAPEVVAVGDRLTVKVSKFGVSQTMTNEVTALEPDRLMRDEQVSGPLKRFVHTHTLEATEAGTRMIDRIEFEPPGGMLGFIVTESVIRRELGKMFEYRAGRFRELLEQGGETG